MKINVIIASAGLGLGLLAVPARATIIDLGVFSPPAGGESAANELAFLNSTVLPAYNSTHNPDLPTATFGTENISGTGTSITLDISDYSYIKLKWDGMWQFYSIIGENGTHTFNSTVFNQNNQPQNLSHYTFFGPDDSEDVPPPGVPDGGNTVMLLGAVLGCLTLLRRYFR